MHRSQAVEILVRLLGLNAGRVAALGVRLADAGLLPRAVGRCVPALCTREKVRLVLAAIADNGLGSAPEMVKTFEALETESGTTLGDVLEGVFRGDTDSPGDCAFQLEPASAMLTIGNTTLYFGAKLRADAAVKIIHIPANVMRAIALEVISGKRTTN